MITAPGVNDFIDLADAPHSYSGQATKVVKVNAGETAVEFGTGAGGSGTVTDVSVTTANGVSGSVATSTTTPTITLTLGAITPSSVVSTGSVTGTNLSGTNTGDNATNSQYSGLAASKQDTLISGTTIKTINSTSLLGSGDIAISGGAFAVISAEIDFGSKPVRSKRITVTDAGITSASKIMVTPNGAPATGRVGNDWEWDTIVFSAVAGMGNFVLTGNASGRVVGKRRFYYTYS